MTEPAPLQVLGIGSPHGDDRAGWAVIAYLQELLGPTAVPLLSLDRPGMALLEYLSAARRTWLVDALWLPERAGEILRPTEAELARRDRRMDCHGFGVAEALALGEALGQRPALELFAIAVGAAEASAAALSAPVERACRRLAGQLAARLAAR